MDLWFSTLQGRNWTVHPISFLLFHLFLFLASLLLVCNHEHDLLWVFILVNYHLLSHPTWESLGCLPSLSIIRRQLNLIHLNFQRTVQFVFSALQADLAFVEALIIFSLNSFHHLLIGVPDCHLYFLLQYVFMTAENILVANVWTSSVKTFLQLSLTL